MTTYCVLESREFSSDFHKSFYSHKVIDGFVISVCRNVHEFWYPLLTEHGVLNHSNNFIENLKLVSDLMINDK